MCARAGPDIWDKLYPPKLKGTAAAPRFSLDKHAGTSPLLNDDFN